MNIMNRELLLSGAKQIGLELSSQQIGKFQEYFNLLNKWGKSINLTAIKSADEIVLKHFLDSLTLHTKINPTAKIIDIGTGAGFPGIPLKIISPESHVCLVDSTAKKIGFLELIIRSLKLENCQAIHSRAEDLANLPEHSNQFHFVTARALASAKELLPLLKPFVAKDGKILLLKGAEAENEIASLNDPEINNIIIHKTSVPGLDARRNIIEISLNR